METCENCGSKVFSGHCVNCDEDYFIRAQEKDKYEPEEFDAMNDDDFEPCQGCDGHSACADFGCAFELGLGHLVQPDPSQDW